MVRFKFLEMIDFNKFYEDGFIVLEDALTSDDLSLLKDKINNVLSIQRNEFDQQKLSEIGEINMCRAPLLYDSYFISLLDKPFVKKICQKILGDYYILQLQNAIVIPPNQTHHQSFYHRDIIHQEFTSSKPLGINIYYCLDTYTEENGGTTFLRGSHKQDKLPLPNDLRTRGEITPTVKAGSVIVFDSMVYHKAGSNSTDQFRYGINTMYTLPFLKQQMDFSTIFGKKYKNDPYLSQIFGYKSREFKSVTDFRQTRYDKIKGE